MKQELGLRQQLAAIDPTNEFHARLMVMLTAAVVLNSSHIDNKLSSGHSIESAVRVAYELYDEALRVERAREKG